MRAVFVIIQRLAFRHAIIQEPSAVRRKAAGHFAEIFLSRVMFLRSDPSGRITNKSQSPAPLCAE